MSKEPSGAADPSLEPREAEVLKAIIREHILSGEPVGSRTVARGARLELSPATIRGVMAELEERELLAQPHTSAGRVPTDKAYRVYVDRLIPKPRIAASQARAIEHAMSRSRGEVQDLLGEASRQLSHFSNQVGLVLAPDLRRILIEHLEFVRLDARRVVAILVARSGVVQNRILEVDSAPPQAELDRIGRHVSAEFGGRTIPEMRELLRARLAEERTAYDTLMATGLPLARRAVEAEGLEGEIFVEGASNLLAFPEFADLGLVRSLLKTLEEKKTLIDLLSGVLESRTLRVVIGEENPLTEMARCSLVASSYGEGDRVIGTVAIVGPTRMAYVRAIALVDYLARVLTRILSSPGN